VRYAAAQEEYRAIFRGIQLELSPEKLRAVATDGFRLALYDAPGGGGLEATLVLPARSADELVRLLKGVEAPVKVAVGEGRLFVLGDDFAAAFALMEGTFPDYERVIPGQYQLEATLDAEALRRALERLKLLADRQSQRVDLAFSEGTLELAAEGELGQGRESLPADTRGETPLVLAYNINYLTDAIKGIKGPVHLKLSGPTSPSVITAEEEPGYLAVVVPLRV